MDSKLLPSKIIPFHGPLVTQSVNFHGHSLLKLLITDNAHQIERINLLDIDYARYQERISFIKKKEDQNKELLEFIANKSDILMVEPKSQLFLKSEHQEYKDRYEHQFPIEYLMRASRKERVKQFMMFIKEGHILLTMINGFMHSVYSLKFLSFDNGPHRYLCDIDAVDIQLIMLPDDTEVSKCDADRFGHWLAGTRLRVEVIKIQDSKIFVGTKGVTDAAKEDEVILGKISLSDLPLIFNTGKHGNITSMSQCFESMKSYNNPQSIKHLASQMNLDLRSYPSLMPSLRQKVPDEECAPNLRKQQMCKWAHKSVAEGVQHFKNGRHDEAFQCLTKALQIDSENVEAYVAKGALLANLGRYEKAVDAFERALKYNPEHANARKYACETLVELGKQHEENKKFNDAEKCYLKCLEINPEHEGCKEALAILFKNLNKDVNINKIVEKIEDDKFFSDLARLDKQSKDKRMMDIVEEPTIPLEKKAPDLSPLSQKLAAQSAMWSCPPPTKEETPSFIPIPSLPSTSTNEWENKTSPKQKYQPGEKEDPYDDKYNALVEEFLRNVNTRVDNIAEKKGKNDAQNSKEKKSRKHSKSYSSSSSSSHSDTDSSEDSSKKKKHKKSRKKSKKSKKSTRDSEQKSKKKISDQDVKNKDSSVNLPHLDYADLEKKLNEYVEQMDMINQDGQKDTLQTKEKTNGESSKSRKSKKERESRERKRKRKYSSSSYSSSSSSSWSSCSSSRSSSRSRSKSRKKDHKLSYSYVEELYKKNNSRSLGHSKKRDSRPRSISPSDRKPQPAYNKAAKYSFNTNSNNRGKGRGRGRGRGRGQHYNYDDFHYNRKKNENSSDAPKSQIFPISHSDEPKKVMFTLQNKKKILSHLSLDVPDKNKEKKEEEKQSQSKFIRIPSPSMRFGKWAPLNQPARKDIKLESRLKSDSPKTLDQFEDFIKKGKEQIIEKMKARNKEFLKPSDAADN